MKGDWLERHFDWCYAVTVIGHVSCVASVGYNFIIVLDLDLLICEFMLYIIYHTYLSVILHHLSRSLSLYLHAVFPMQYTARHQSGAVPWKTHAAVWLTGVVCE
jgi:hypothetical protein